MLLIIAIIKTWSMVQIVAIKKCLITFNLNFSNKVQKLIFWFFLGGGILFIIIIFKLNPCLFYCLGIIRGNEMGGILENYLSNSNKSVGNQLTPSFICPN